MSVIWTSRTRTKQPQGAVQLAGRYNQAKFSAIASVPKTPLVGTNGIATILSNDGYATGVGGQAWSVTTAANRHIQLQTSGGSATSIEIPAGGSWTFLLHARLSSVPTGYPGWWRTGTDNDSDTFFVVDDTGTTPWVRVAGNQILQPGASGEAVPSGIETVYVCSMASSSKVTVAWNGRVRHSATHATAQTGANVYAFGWEFSQSASLPGNWYSITWLPWAVSDAEAAELSTPAGYYGNVFAPERRPVFIGSAGGGPTNYPLTADAGSYAVTGVAANLKLGRKLVAAAGSYTVTGVAANLKFGYSIAAGAGSYAVTGVSANLKLGRKLVAEAGAYTYTGIAATLNYTPVGGSPYTLVAATGSYSVSGNSAGLTVQRKLVAAAGSYAVTGVDATLTRSGYRLTAGTGAYAYTGNAVTITTTGAVAATTQGGGTSTGRNLTKKQKKKQKAVESQEWLKAEDTARQLLQDRFSKQTPQEKAKALETYVQSLQPVIDALKALTVAEVETPTLPPKEPLVEETIVELTPHQELLDRFTSLEKKMKSVEELIIVLIADL